MRMVVSCLHCHQEKTWCICLLEACFVGSYVCEVPRLGWGLLGYFVYFASPDAKRLFGTTPKSLNFWKDCPPRHQESPRVTRHFHHIIYMLAARKRRTWVTVKCTSPLRVQCALVTWMKPEMAIIGGDKAEMRARLKRREAGVDADMHLYLHQ